jgi:penicillin-binding protein 1A
VPERPANIRIVAADGQMMSNRGKMGGEAVALADLPQYVPEAFIAIEDKRFYSHFGIDLTGLGAVALESMRAGHVTRGASTLTQQLAKNLFLTPTRPSAARCRKRCSPSGSSTTTPRTRSSSSI